MTRANSPYLPVFREVVQVNAIEARLAGEHLIEIGEVIVDKMGEGLRWVHA